MHRDARLLVVLVGEVRRRGPRRDLRQRRLDLARERTTRCAVEVLGLAQRRKRVGRLRGGRRRLTSAAPDLHVEVRDVPQLLRLGLVGALRRGRRARSPPR